MIHASPPRYNPEKDAIAGIRGGCAACWDIYHVHRSRLELDRAVREFLRHAAPWIKYRRSRESRTRNAVTVEDPAPISLIHRKRRRGPQSAAPSYVTARSAEDVTYSVATKARLINAFGAVGDREHYFRIAGYARAAPRDAFFVRTS
jgi:hypothetical protein